MYFSFLIVTRFPSNQINFRNFTYQINFLRNFSNQMKFYMIFFACRQGVVWQREKKNKKSIENLVFRLMGKVFPFYNRIIVTICWNWGFCCTYLWNSPKFFEISAFICLNWRQHRENSFNFIEKISIKITMKVLFHSIFKNRNDQKS